MGDDHIFFKVKSFSNISQNPFDYKNNPDFSYTQNGSHITVENNQVTLSFSASANKEGMYTHWNLDVLTIKKKTSLSGLGEYIGWSLAEVLKEFPNAQTVEKDYLCYANIPEYCFISFYFKRGKVSKITFVDDYY